ncbi:MAG: ORF6N domain-containing protein [Bacilli bacterium]|nr:ORF6N domain-containing protein [Bacilli bacterium]
MTEIITQNKDIKDLVYVIRGQQVMLDSDLAALYGYEVKAFNQQVKRNSKRFPEDFMFQLTRIELESVKSQFVTSPNNLFEGQGDGRRKLPYVFSEQGIYMLTSVLKSEIAIQQSIFIIRKFREMRHYIAENAQLLNNQDMLQISNRLARHEEDIVEIKTTMATKSDIDKIMENFIDENNIKEITILNGQKFEAIEAYTNIYKQAQHSIYIIDDYINIETLSFFKCKKENVDVVLFSDNKGTGTHKLRQHEIDVFNTEYPNLVLKRNSIAHDRYIVID